MELTGPEAASAPSRCFQALSVSMIDLLLAD